MPRPKPDQIIRHQIVFGEADRKILDRAIDSYTLSNLTKNAVTLMNDVTGMVTFLTLLGATGILGASFIFKVNEGAVAKGATEIIIEEFRNQYKDAVQRRQVDRETAQERGASVVGGLENLVDQILKPFFAITGGIEMPEIRRP